jgi:hypothetical protein
MFCHETHVSILLSLLRSWQQSARPENGNWHCIQNLSVGQLPYLPFCKNKSFTDLLSVYVWEETRPQFPRFLWVYTSSINWQVHIPFRVHLKALKCRHLSERRTRWVHTALLNSHNFVVRRFCPRALRHIFQPAINMTICVCGREMVADSWSKQIMDLNNFF